MSQEEYLVKREKSEENGQDSNLLFPSSADGTQMRASKVDISSISFWKIEPSFLPSKITYFLLDFTNGCIIPFLVPFLSSIGLNMKEIGLIAGFRFVASSIASPFWGYLADCTGKAKYIFGILCFGATVTIFPMPWVAHTFKNSNWSVRNMTSSQDYDGEMSNGTFLLTNGIFSSNNLFYVMFALVFMSCFFTNSLICFVDSFVMNIVSSHNPSQDNYYGMQKLFGAIGFALSSFLAGIICDMHFETLLSTYTPAFCVFLPSALLLMPFGFKLASQTTTITESDGQEINKWKLFVSTFRSFDNLIFLVTAFVMGIAQSIAFSFLLKLLEDELDASKTIMGLAHLISSFSEMVIFFLSKRILKLCRGSVGCIELAVFAYAVRYLVMSYSSEKWVILPIQLLSSLSFALYWAAALEYTQKIAANSIYVTVFSIINNTYYNIAGVIGTVFGGLFYHRFGGRMLFRTTAYMCLGWLLIMVLYYHVFRKFLTSRSKGNDVHNNEKGVKKPIYKKPELQIWEVN